MKSGKLGLGLSQPNRVNGARSEQNGVKVKMRRSEVGSPNRWVGIKSGK